ncbi:barstar family protein [Campylobacter concisus]|uniref:Barstar, ribonuclease (Barnase) inhibitor n=1 Tax=Campylobacter concisus TaxID=199 RepID=A0A0M4STD7_9BACT|nr:barstar family protein [Campylobacter concisus]ALF47054.1 Barstar, ribonuclease (Barnase) inhibitor [Campylobacter concisus]
MKSVILDAKKMLEKEKMHEYIAKKFELPEYYGRNLDALFDSLCEISEPTFIKLKNENSLDDSTKESLALLFRDVCNENKMVKFELVKDEK